MSVQHYAQIRSYLGRRVHSPTGLALGRVEDLLADTRSHAPQWLVLRLVGVREGHRALPLVLVLETERGLVAPVTRRILLEAPLVSLRSDLTAQQELGLRRYWMDH